MIEINDALFGRTDYSSIRTIAIGKLDLRQLILSIRKD